MAQVILLTDVTQAANDPNWGRPIGAYVLATKARLQGYSCVVIDHFTKHTDISLLLEQVIGPDTLFVGISSTFLTAETIDTDKRTAGVVEYSSGYLWTHSFEEFNNYISYLRELILKYSNNKIIPLVLGGSKALFFYKIQKLEISLIFT